MRSVRAAWLRGGTSKGLFFRAADLPLGLGRDSLVLAAIGSPDPSGLQLNGVGGGLSSTSKVAIVSPSARPGYDVDYLFGQVEIKERRISWQGSCGNLAAGVGLFALAEGLGKCSSAERHTQVLKVWQENQGYGIMLHIPTGVDMPTTNEGTSRVNTLEEPPLLELAGVPGREPPIYVQLLEPHAGKRLLATGNIVDALTLPNGALVDATLVTAGNPTVFVAAADVGLAGTELPSDMDYSKVLPLVEHLRAQAAPLFGIDGPSDQPRVAFLTEPQDYKTTSSQLVKAEAADVLSRISTPGRIHHAHTGTGSIALACAAQVQGSVAWRCRRECTPADGLLRIGHPGGVAEVRADVRLDADGTWHAAGAGFERTARYLMRGEVFVPHPDRAP